MTQLLIRHHVADYNQWRPVYDAHYQDRQAAGISEVSLWCDENDSNEVYVLFDIADRTKAQAFIDSADLRQTMQQAGVQSTPEFTFLARN